MTEQLLLHRDGPIAVLSLHRPPHNHLNTPLLRELADAVSTLDHDTECRVILLAGAGKNFCAGADLAAPGVTENSDWLSGFYEQAMRLFAARKPIIAAVQGAVVGGGLGLALAADFRVAAPSARFWANFVKLGSHPGFAITETLPRLIGTQRAAQMLLTGRPVKAAEAASWGLVDGLSKAEHDLPVVAMKFASAIAENAPLSVAAIRATLRHGLAEAAQRAMSHELEQQSALRRTLDYAEGVRAVAERRTGRFVGR
jgi:enoyl-CoA hydratase/carnithine racemase